MTIFVYGGSNTLRKDGRAALLAERHPAGGVVNRSIGAATSLMAIFRMLTNPDTGPRPGDTVIWEYALNEANHVTRGYDPEIALRNLERFIRECALRKLHLVAAIFTPRGIEQAETRLPLFGKIHQLLAEYGVASFDVSQAWRAAHSVRHMPAHLYLDNAHYSRDPDLYAFIANGVMKAIQTASVPKLPPPLRAGHGRLQVQLFEAGSVYKNALVSVPIAPHRSVLPFDREGQIIGVAALVHPNAQCALRLELTRKGHCGSWVNISTAGIESADKTILKVFSLEAALGSAWHVEPGDSLTILPLRRVSPVYAESHTRPDLRSLDATQPASFIGVVLDVPN